MTPTMRLPISLASQLLLMLATESPSDGSVVSRPEKPAIPAQCSV